MGLVSYRVQRTAWIVAFAMVVAASFQNCAKANFAAADNSSSSSSLSTTTLPPTNVSISPLACAAGQTTNSTAQQYFPTPCLKSPMLAQNTLGLEMNNNYILQSKNGGANVFLLDSDSPLGISKDTQLYVEIATYVVPDSIVLLAVDAAGNETKILDICNIGTSLDGNPSGATTRPYSDNILQFNVVLPKGTRHLKYDFSQAESPTYVGVWNLGEFSMALANSATNPFASAQPRYSNYYRAMNMLPTALNDNADRAQGAITCN